MKKAWILVALVCMVVLCGCNAQQTMETVADDKSVFAPKTVGKIQLSIPADVPVLENTDGGQLYLCDGYTVAVQTLAGGDIGKTFQQISGYDQDSLTVMKTVQDGNACYESAWCTAGEGGDQTCRGLVLDDGVYHYAVTVMADYALAGSLQEIWGDLFDSILLSTG